MGVGRVGDSRAAEVAAQRAAEAAAQRAAEAAARRAAEAQAAAEAARRAAEAQRSSFEPAGQKNTLRLDGQGGAPASSLFTENSKDGKVNCLDKAADWVNKSSPELQSRSELVFLKDSRAGAEGQTGHVVVRQGERVLDPSSGKSYDDMKSYLKEQPHYSEAGSIPGTTAAKVFSTEAGSPERAKALSDAKVSPELQQMMVADPGVPSNAPNAATATPYEVNVPGQAGPVSVEFSSTLEKEVEKKDGYTTVKLTAEMEASASGSLDMKKVSVGGGVSTGKSQTYEVKMKDEDFERLKRGEIPPPHPLKPETVPDKASVTMESSQLKGWSGEASVEALKVELGLGEEHKSGKGMSIQTERDGDKVKVTGGPTELLESGLSVSVGVGPASVSLTGTTSMTHYKLRTAEFDLSNKDGRAAFDKYASSGELPFKDGNGVSGAAKVEKLDLSSKSTLEAALGPLKGSVDVVPESNSSIVETTHPDGSKDATLDLKRSNGHELNYERHIDANGKEDYSKQKFSLFMKGMEGDVEELYAQAYKVDQHEFDKENDIKLTFTPDQMTQLSQRARDYVAKMDQLSSTGWRTMNRGDAFIDALAKAQNPGDVANALTQYSDDPNWMGDAMARLRMGSNRDTPLPGDITAQNRND
ncbi:hypothetical protein [Vitiosangium sp. GDMCC 1.1324]|uniref:hypothetical protein n=1 Tax=Vitiosangium sp. (strain GDMCC 1.1324) TaxID=2138576 RepID=UPI000D445289|nr:hypothetical protein [Vitiosangium sp. GDMCC 1.1324]PTL84995.1 hypothetical protein DAT35_08090 [Vitiosangium sp. GDMCC 1.1324]